MEKEHLIGHMERIIQSRLLHNSLSQILIMMILHFTLINRFLYFFSFFAFFYFSFMLDLLIHHTIHEYVEWKNWEVLKFLFDLLHISVSWLLCMLHNIWTIFRVKIDDYLQSGSLYYVKVEHANLEFETSTFRQPSLHCRTSFILL